MATSRPDAWTIRAQRLVADAISTIRISHGEDLEAFDAFTEDWGDEPFDEQYSAILFLSLDVGGVERAVVFTRQLDGAVAPGSPMDEGESDPSGLIALRQHLDRALAPSGAHVSGPAAKGAEAAGPDERRAMVDALFEELEAAVGAAARQAATQYHDQRLARRRFDRAGLDVRFDRRGAATRDDRFANNVDRGVEPNGAH